MRKPVFRVSDQIRPDPTQTGLNSYRLELSDLDSRWIVLYIVKKATPVTAQLICALKCVFAYMRNANFLMARLIYQF